MILVSTWIGQNMSTVIGRVQSIILIQSLGICSLMAMAILTEQFGITDWRLLVPLYIFRSGLMNCTYPLKESILMDYVPQDQRARWKSLDSVSSFGWCGSAFLGGILADKFSYGWTFFLTAALQGIGTVSKVWLLPLVSADEKGEGERVREEEEREEREETEGKER